MKKELSEFQRKVFLTLVTKYNIAVPGNVLGRKDIICSILNIYEFFDMSIIKNSNLDGIANGYFAENAHIFSIEDVTRQGATGNTVLIGRNHSPINSYSLPVIKPEDFLALSELLIDNKLDEFMYKYKTMDVIRTDDEYKEYRTQHSR